MKFLISGDSRSKKDYVLRQSQQQDCTVHLARKYDKIKDTAVQIYIILHIIGFLEHDAQQTTIGETTA